MQVEVNGLDYCYCCNSTVEECGGVRELNTWQIIYKCGCHVYGSYDDNKVFVEKVCPVYSENEHIVNTSDYIS